MTAEKTPTNATININRHTWDTEHSIEITLKFGVGKSVTAKLSAEDFALALTGRSDIDIEVITRNVDLVIRDE